MSYSVYKSPNQENDRVFQNTLDVLDQEKQTILSEILKCVVCLEVPKKKQVFICEVGHHFCSDCHKKLRCCGICRGPLSSSRNFVVEEIITKLEPVFWSSENSHSFPIPPVKYTPGSYKCLHGCKITTPCHKMLSHLRARHSDCLVDNVRSNPSSSQFDLVYNILLQKNKKYAQSAQVSDMGLFTVVTEFNEKFDFVGCAKILGNDAVSSVFEYQLAVTLQFKSRSRPFLQYSITDCDVKSYTDDCGNDLLRVRGEDLLQFADKGAVVEVYFSVWRKGSKQERKAVIPTKPIMLQSDRKARRNKNRNRRRKEVKSLKKFMYSKQIQSTQICL